MVEGARIIPEQYRQQIAKAETRDERHKLFLEARREIYRTAALLREQISVQGREIDIEAATETLNLTPQQTEILQRTIDILDGDNEKCTEFWESQQTENGHFDNDSEWLEEFLGKRPVSTVTVSHNTKLGCIELLANNVYDINKGLISSLYQETNATEIGNLALWGETFPAKADIYGVTQGYYTTISRQNPFPVIAVGLLNRDMILAHERSHHVSSALDMATAETQSDLGIVSIQAREEALDAFYYRANFFKYGTTSKLLDDMERIVETVRRGYQQNAKGEVMADFEATGSIHITQNVMPGGQYDYFVSEFNARIGEYPEKVQTLLKRARDAYYAELIENIQPINECFDYLRSQGDEKRLKEVIGMINATPLHLWARWLSQIMK